MNTGNAYDVLVENVSSRVLTMTEIMNYYRSYKARGEYEKARAALEYAVECCYLPAKLELARLLKDTPQLRMSQRERYRYAERLYREVQNVMDLPDEVYAQIAWELAALCDLLNRPVGCLGNLLKAKRYGHAVQDQELDRCRRRLQRMDIYSFGANHQDCLDLGCELTLAGNFTDAEFFLREASDSRDRILAGQACLMLADLYAQHASDCRNHWEESRRHYRKAVEKQFPEFLLPER